MPAQSVIGSAVTTISRTITVAAGALAPGHLGELTRIVPFELADAVLAEAGAVQRRLRLLPSRVGLYFVLALGLFPGAGYLGVHAKLTAELGGLGLAVPSGRALRDLRRRLGAAPLKAVFEVLAGPVASRAATGPGVMRVCYVGTGHGAESLGPSPRSVTSTRGGACYLLTGSEYHGGLTISGRKCPASGEIRSGFLRGLP